MKKLILIITVLVFISCKKDEISKNYGCVSGVNKATGQRQYIKCIPQRIYQAGNNQEAAAKISADLGIETVDVSYWNSFTSISFQPNEKCNCQ